MLAISPDSVAAIQPELISGEGILWAGRPNTSTVFHKEDLFLIPFSLLWGGFAIFWEAGVSGYWGNSTRSGPWVFGMFWGIPFVLIGQYLIWGRFFYAAWKRKRTYYAVTNRRVIVVQNGWKRQMASAYLAGCGKTRFERSRRRRNRHQTPLRYSSTEQASPKGLSFGNSRLNSSPNFDGRSVNGDSKTKRLHVGLECI